MFQKLSFYLVSDIRGEQWRHLLRVHVHTKRMFQWEVGWRTTPTTACSGPSATTSAASCSPPCSTGSTSMTTSSSSSAAAHSSAHESSAAWPGLVQYAPSTLLAAWLLCSGLPLGEQKPKTRTNMTHLTSSSLHRSQISRCCPSEDLGKVRMIYMFNVDLFYIFADICNVCQHRGVCADPGQLDVL